MKMHISNSVWQFSKWLNVLALLLWVSSGFSQYLETFSTPNKGYQVNFQNDFTGVGWTLTPWALQPPAEFGRDDMDYFQTTANGKLESIDLDQEVCWQSPLLTVISSGTILFTADLTWNGYDGLQTNPSEHINVEYQINGGSWVRHPNILGSAGDPGFTVKYNTAGTFNSSATTDFGSIPVTAGNSFSARICISNNAAAELVTIDNVSVSGVSAGCAAPVLSTVVTQVGCNNPNSGAINLSVSAGNPPYTYDWSNDGPETPDNDPQDLSGLAVGSYTVTVTDAASCSATTTVMVTQAPPILLSTQVLSASCNGIPDGEVDLIVSGGVPGYTYDWSNDGPEMPDNDPQDLIGVIPGTYMVTVTDASGCTASTSSMVGVQSATAYMEQFNIANKGYLPDFIDDFSAVNWSLSSWSAQPPAATGRDNADFFRTSSGALVGVDFDQEVCWTSPVIARGTATQFTLDLSWTGFDVQSDEYINVKYKIDQGAFVTIPNLVGGGLGTIQYAGGLDQNGNITVTQAGLTGNALQIQVCGQFNASAETMTLDNVSVPGSLPYCPTPEATLTDALIVDNGITSKADPGDRIRLTTTISNNQSIDYTGVSILPNNDLRVTMVSGSFRSTPVAVNDTYATSVNSMLSVLSGSGVLSNDFDNHIPGLMVTSFSSMSNQGGSVNVNANGSFTYNPPMGFTGQDSFTYTITDSDMQTNTGTVSINVN